MDKRRERHAFHLVPSSSLPFSLAWLLFYSVLLLFAAIGPYKDGFASESDFFYLLALDLLFLISTVLTWLVSIVTDATYYGRHTIKVQNGIRLGFKLFIASEVMLFFSLFWGLFHFGLAPSVYLGMMWPPSGVMLPSPFGIPLLGTCLLL